MLGIGATLLDLTCSPDAAAVFDACRRVLDTVPVVFHGTCGAEVLSRVEPRKANDAAKDSGNRCAVYATTDVRVAIAHAIFNRPYVTATLSSYVLGYAFDGDRLTFRVTDDLHRLFVDADPNLFTDGYLYALDRARFVAAPESATEYASSEPQTPLLVVKVPRWLAEDLFAIVVPYWAPVTAFGGLACWSCR